MRLYFDTSVLVAFAVKGHAQHVAAYTALERMVRGKRARGDAGVDSDYDIAVFLKDLSGRWAEADKVYEPAPVLLRRYAVEDRHGLVWQNDVDAVFSSVAPQNPELAARGLVWNSRERH